MNKKRKNSNTSAQRSRLLFFGIVIAVLGLVVYLTLAGDDTGGGPGRSGGGSDQDTSTLDFGEIDADTLSELLEYRLSRGKAYEYNFNRTMSAKIKGETMVDLDLGGQLTPHVVKAEQGRLDLIIAVRLDRTKGIEAQELPAFKRGGANVTYLAYLQIDHAGHALFLRFPPETDRAEQGLIRDIIAAWLQPLPGAGAPARTAESRSIFQRVFGSDDAPVFSVSGSDTQGLFDAALQFAQGRSASELNLAVAKESYRDSLTPVKIESSDHKVAWKIDQGTFGGSSGTDRFIVGPPEFQVDSTMAYSFDLSGVSDATFTAGDLGRFTQDSDIYDVAAYMAEREVEIPTRTKAKPWVEIKPRLQSVTADMDGEQRTEIFNTLAVSVKANPALAHEAAQAARGYASTDHRFQMVLGALSYGGSVEAQTELVRMYQGGGLDQVGLESVIDAYTLMSEKATPESLKLLQDAFSGNNEELSNRAGLALGSAQRRNPTAKLRDWMRDRWDAARNDHQRQTVLEYIGNSGDPKLLDIVDEALRVGDESVRMKALAATRFMDDPEVNTFLLKYFGNDRMPERLRYEALSSLANHYWEERFLPVMEDCVRSEKMDAIRMRCARFTLEQLPYQRRMKELLSGLRSGTKSPAMLEFIQRETAD